ncbi:hypothetical protein NKF26_11990 [Haladaptatus sp. AB618]|uniref:hypothetical protein n=1 Tax=Haladaptatus sp. AB618 TaxID=2934173 RepID=UPI00209BDF3B|nr:hypothetical protein [Haladaptatus sp. AB618]MCO8254523.1 hypothetical protein [Haladaptatus sp. AB618]
MKQEYSDPPYKVSDIGYLTEVCKFVRDQPKSREEIKENTDVANSNKVVHFGLELKFLQEIDEGISTTQSGVQISYSSTDFVELFREAIQEYPLYHDLLKAVRDNQDQVVKEEEYIPRTEIEKHLRITLGIEISDYKAGRSADTFLLTLEAANLGNRIIGRGSKPTRIEISDEFFESVSDILNESTNDEETPLEPGSTQNSDQQRVDLNGETGFDELLNEFSSQSTVNLDVQLTVEGTDDPENIRDIILSIRKGLEQELDYTGTEESLGSTKNLDLEDEENEELSTNPDGNLSQFTEET